MPAQFPDRDERRIFDGDDPCSTAPTSIGIASIPRPDHTTCSGASMCAPEYTPRESAVSAHSSPRCRSSTRRTCTGGLPGRLTMPVRSGTVTSIHAFRFSRLATTAYLNLVTALSIAAFNSLHALSTPVLRTSHASPLAALIMVRGPLIGTVQDFPVDIVLVLCGCRVAPSNRLGPSVPLEFTILALLRRHSSVKVIHHAGASISIHRVQHPAEKSRRFVREADAMKGIDGKCSIPDPGIAVIPIPSSSDQFRERGRRRSDNRAILKMIQ